MFAVESCTKESVAVALLELVERDPSLRPHRLLQLTVVNTSSLCFIEDLGTLYEI